MKSFGVKSRFVHFEFFRLTQDQEGMGRKGDVVALEVNMRPAGGYTPDMLDFSLGQIDAYTNAAEQRGQIWAR